MKIGYLGLGHMGGALASRLQLTHKLHVFDLNRTAVDHLVEQGATACSGPEEMADQCDVVFMCLPKSDHVRAVLFGPHGMKGRLRAGALIVDQTTGDPMATRAMAAELAQQEISLIDAPVSGGVTGAEAGTIAIMVGAGQAPYARIEPVLRCISPHIFHAGDVGAGQVIKLVNNLISGVQRLLTLEGVTLAAKNGIDPAKACEILLAGGGRNAFLEKFMATQILKGKLDVGFTLGLMYKDMGLACALGHDSGVPLPFGNLARDMYQMCIADMGVTADVQTAALVFDRMAGTCVVPQINRNA
jgi:3-hydroxyisobutyrate dehydrogenase